MKTNGTRFRRPLLAVQGLLLVVFALSLVVPESAQAQVFRGGQNTRRLVTQPIDERNLVSLLGNTHPAATLANDRGAVPDSLPLEHLQLQLQRPAELEQKLEKFMAEQQRPGSPVFHHWLTAKQFGQRYGVAPDDVQKITDWLVSHGFRVDSVFPSGMVIEFSGSAGQIKEAFHTEIHRLEVEGTPHIANMSDPKIPAALAGVVMGVTSLHDFMPHSNLKPHADFTWTCPSSVCGTTTTFYAVVPADLATIYNLNPVFAANVTGAGQTIAVIEDTNLKNTSDVTTFRTNFGLSGYSGTFSQENPSGSATCNSPGVNGGETEAALDAEWAGAAAPNAAVVLASCKDTTTFGGLIAIQNLINGSHPPQILSVSYGECEADNGSAANQSYVNAYQQAASEGVSVFVSAGDEGAASCDVSAAAAIHGIAVSGYASTPYNVAVGGTDFGDTYGAEHGGAPLSASWGSSNNSAFGSALSYIPEIPWNNSCASQLIYTTMGYSAPYGASGFCNSSAGTNYVTDGAGSGGPSTFSSKPAWQSLVGNPSDGHRDLPDVSLFAATGVWGHFFEYCMTDTNEGGTACTYSNPTDALALSAGGTSFSTPIWAGIQALINQSAGGSQGNPNPRLYALAGIEYGASGSSGCNASLGTTVGSNCVFYDVTLGDTDVDCMGTTNCYDSGGTSKYGALSPSSSTFSPAYGATTGWDFATGIGTVNVLNLVNDWKIVSTTTAVTSSANPSAYGQTVTFTAKIKPAIGSSETGTVSWSSITGCAASPVSSGVATCTTTSLPNGTNAITATYSGDVNYSSSSGSLSGGQIVTQASTTTTVGSSTNPSSYGQSVTFTATITSATGMVRSRNSARPELVTGSVNWSANTGCGTTSVTSGDPGTATCTTSALPVGTDTITATYSGDSNHGTASGSLSQTVNLDANTVTFTTMAPSSAEYGSSFTVAASGLGTGAITYTSDGVVCTNSGATYTMIAGSGTCTVTATQAADSHYQSASASESVTATDANSSVNVTSSQNPSTFGQSVTFTATITSDTGMVRGRNGATNKRSGRPRAISGTVVWSSNTGCSTASVTTGYPGTATCTTSALPAGTNTITAAYSGDGNHNAATGTLSGGQVVSTATTITLTPALLSFGNEALNNSSAAKVVTVKNTGTATLDISNISLAVGINYSISGNTCGATLAASKTCKVSVKFTPTSLGALNDTLTFTDNASGSPQSVALSGTGVVAAALTPASETYAKQTVGTTSTAKTLTLTNNQSVALTSISISTTGDFAVSTTTCGTSLASKGKCAISVTFTPTTTGTRTGQLIINDSASNSPQTSNLKGTGK